jgi:hypothetical protein
MAVGGKSFRYFGVNEGNFLRHIDFNRGCAEALFFGLNHNKAGELVEGKRGGHSFSICHSGIVGGGDGMAYNTSMNEPIAEKVIALKLRWLVLALLALLALGGFVALFWRLETPKPLPTSVLKSITGFTPYFYAREIPAGYSVDTAHIVSSADLLIVTLISPGAPSIVLTEQPTDTSLTTEKLQGEGERVDVGNVADFATVNKVEGRLVGVVITRDPKTLVILNTSSADAKDALVSLLRSLKPVR